MNSKKRGIALLLMIAMVLCQIQFSGATKKVKSTTITQSAISLTVGTSKTIGVKGTKISKVIWKSSNMKKATVFKKGKLTAWVKGVNAGTATVTATVYASGQKKKVLTCKVSVVEKNSPLPTVKPTIKPTSQPTIKPTAIPTMVPTTVPTVTPTVVPTAKSETIMLDLSKATKGVYDTVSKTLSLKNVDFTDIALGTSVAVGDVAEVVIKGNMAGTAGFRAWFGSGGGNLSEPLLSTKLGVESGKAFSVTGTTNVLGDTSNFELKGFSWGATMDDLTITSIQLNITRSTVPVVTPTPKPTTIPASALPSWKYQYPSTTVLAKASLPLVYSDVPDVDYTRVGEWYYMISTTMFLSPGIPVMKSKDLVHWQIVNYVYDTLENNDISNLVGGKNCYGQGSWAASIKQSNGKFYVCFNSNDQGKFYVYTTDDLEKGTFKKYTMSGVKHDPSLIFDNDKTYVVYGQGTIYVQEITLSEADHLVVNVGTATRILAKASEKNTLNIEGCHAYKIGNYYYLFFIEWPANSRRIQWCYRSTSLLSTTWEGRVVFDDVGGYGNAGIAQGGIIDTQNGDWYSILFQDHGAVGRVPVLLEVFWSDNWPVLGSRDGNGNGLMTALNDMTVNLPKSGDNYVYGNDDFNYQSGDKLKLVWQWNHNPDNSSWSVTEKSGFLRLKTGALATGIADARNSLTQRTFGPTCTSEVKIDVTNMKQGDMCGLAAFANAYGTIGVKYDQDGTKYIVQQAGNYKGKSCKDNSKVLLIGKEIYLKIGYDFNNSVAKFYYSLDGANWNLTGSPLSLQYDTTIFMGYRSYLFNYATSTLGGYADFDYYKTY